MNELNASVLKGFGLRAGRIVKEKAYYICDTPNGLRMIHKTPEDGDRIRFQHAIKEHAAQTGYPWVDRYCIAESGLPYTTVAGENYVMTAYFERKEPDFASWPDFARVLEAVARWHRAVRNVAFGEQTKIFMQTTPLTEVFAKQGAELASIRKRVTRQARLSDFDVLFIKNAGYYTRQVKNALHDLEHTDYAVWCAQAASQRHICHNALKEESLPASGDQVYVTQYTDACVDMQLNDLCGLIRRYAQRAGVNAAPPSAVLEAYDRIEPISSEGVAILHALLQYPYHFIKIVTQYYSKKRTWTPNAITNRMLAAVSEKEAYEQYIHMLA